MGPFRYPATRARYYPCRFYLFFVPLGLLSFLSFSLSLFSFFSFSFFLSHLCFFFPCLHKRLYVLRARVAALYMHREALCLCTANDRARVEIESGFSRFAIRSTDHAREDLPVPYMDSSRIHRSILRSILDYDSRTAGATFLAVPP